MNLDQDGYPVAHNIPMYGANMNGINEYNGIYNQLPAQNENVQANMNPAPAAQVLPTVDNDDQAGNDSGSQRKKGSRSAVIKYWSEDEDLIVKTAVAEYTRDHPEIGDKIPVQLWTIIADQLENRSSKQVRDRWINYLAPGLDVNAPWTADEDARMEELRHIHGNKWKIIASHLPGRSENAVKNRYYASMRKFERYVSKSMNENAGIKRRAAPKRKRQDDNTMSAGAAAVAMLDTINYEEDEYYLLDANNNTNNNNNDINNNAVVGGGGSAAVVPPVIPPPVATTAATAAAVPIPLKRRVVPLTDRIKPIVKNYVDNLFDNPGRVEPVNHLQPSSLLISGEEHADISELVNAFRRVALNAVNYAVLYSEAPDDMSEEQKLMLTNGWTESMGQVNAASVGLAQCQLAKMVKEIIELSRDIIGR